MAELTHLEEKLAEVIGLAMAAQGTTEKVEKLLKGNEELARELRTMREEAARAERRATEVAGTLDGKKSAVMQKARETKKKATEMMRDYLAGSAEALDGYEFMTMAEAGEVGHWAVLGELNKKARNPEIARVVREQLPVQKRHLKQAQEGALVLARDEDPNATG